MAKAKLPDGFVSEWHYERYKDDLARELEGALNRKAALEEMKSHPDELEAADEAIKEIRKQITAAGKPAAAKRPAKAEEKR